ncbi:GyrI-like domain-containing protein [Paenibacillus mendelii]|uniref:GyrI-like domain-containing protein n=1 Tax=Paenibacillus mendelii TaxID=206163 RepID=A0ABV6JF70_9BACL|nr:effector binding domain-containing protein [Paenibacillus mendelii]MCQ6557439.1 effector binding domain-containing protein [Paenibacillus mendelii]
MMEVYLVEKEAIRLIGMSVQTKLQDAEANLVPLNDSYNKRIAEINNQVHSSFDYAVSIDPPDYHVETDEFTFIIGAEVDDLNDVPLGMVSLELPSYTYASVKKTGDSTFGFLMKWVNASPHFELAETYSIEFDRSQEEVTLMFPLKKK